jgi:hypothetical protein
LPWITNITGLEESVGMTATLLANARGKWHAYEPMFEANDLVDALDVIESDHYGCFFG